MLKYMKLQFQILCQILYKVHIFYMYRKRVLGGNPQKTLKNITGKWIYR